MDYMLDPPDDPPMCEIHNCELIEDADEDGLYAYCPQCAGETEED